LQLAFSEVAKYLLADADRLDPMDGPVSERRLPIATLGSTLPAIAWATLSRQPKAPVHNVFAAWSEYWVDAVQRSVLFLDVLRQRGNTAVELATHDSPNVLGFATELVLDGRSFERPVNYLLHAIVPPEGIAVDLKARPFIVFDPRAGHGPGIGGMRLDSEIGAALRAGNPCYFVGFRPKPEPGQTIEDVCQAEAAFIREVIRRHPEAPAAPALIGNCQAGWQLMMTAAMNPELPGPILLAGTPLSYWQGTRGQKSLRYLGGLQGGTWLAALASDLGAGIFDGALLVENFEKQNPANTLFRKPYNVYDNVDKEAERFLGFERWWGTPVLLNGDELQWIVDNLFVGNRLAAGQLRTSDGFRIDLRNIRSPIIVFCSHGDDVTPPQQALGWLLDMYEHESDIVAAGQTIIYTVHETVGHLGIFVSGKVAGKEHEEFATGMDMIDLTPPGLFEAVIDPITEDTANRDLIVGRHLFRLERRSLNDIRKLGFNSREDDKAFAAVLALSEVNNGLYRTFLQPFVRAMVTPEIAEKVRASNPYRLRFTAFSDRNPMAKAIAPLAEQVKANRQPVDNDNPYRVLEHRMADAVEQSLKKYGTLLDTMREAAFYSIYNSPLVQALSGLAASNTVAFHRIGRSVMRDAAAAKMQLELANALYEGGAVAALLRAVNYIYRAERKIDERAFTELERYLAGSPDAGGMSFQELKHLLRTQSLINDRDEEAALAALPDLLPKDEAGVIRLLGAIRRIAEVGGTLSPASAERLERIEQIFAEALVPLADPAPSSNPDQS
jgi:pimeloyl-ACP methyl ester carboxylesterase